MSSLERIVITSKGTTDDFKSNCNLVPGALDAMNNFLDYLAGLTAGAMPGATLDFNVGTAKATGTLTVAAGGSSNGNQMSLCNVLFTAVSGTPTGNQFQVNADEEVQAANMAAAFNASANLAGKITATSALGVVTITAVVPGLMGNGLNLDEGSLANVTKSAFANGADGTAYQIELG